MQVGSQDSPGAQDGPERQAPGRAAEQALAQRITRFVETWGAEGDFDDLALSLFNYQYQHNAPYARFCRSRGLSPGAVTDWSQIPAAPADAFRTQNLSCSPEAPAALFRTSGTTSGLRGQHRMSPAALCLYELSLRTAFSRLAGRAAGLPVRALVAPYEDSPDSSLSFMVSDLARQSAPPARFFWKEGGPDFSTAAAAMAAEDQPIVLWTTAFALAQWLETLPGPLPLPPGSIVIETGGFKGRTKVVERDELYRMTSDRLQLPLENIASEYGMCEMASQFYDNSLAADFIGTGSGLPPPVKHGPPWVRTRLIHPATGEPAAAGAPGLLQHIDLCNLNSVLCIRTMDRGQPVEGGFLLLGRLAGAPPRGCSLTAEEWELRTASGT